jgi:hypothetical protein
MHRTLVPRSVNLAHRGPRHGLSCIRMLLELQVKSPILLPIPIPVPIDNESLAVLSFALLVFHFSQPPFSLLPVVF